MITINQSPASPEQFTSASKPEMLIAAVLHLMSHYSSRSAFSKDRHACVKLAAVIERHLSILSELNELGPILRETCTQLSEQWQLVIEHTLQEQRKERLAKRWRQFTQFT